MLVYMSDVPDRLFNDIGVLSGSSNSAIGNVVICEFELTNHGLEIPGFLHWRG